MGYGRLIRLNTHFYVDAIIIDNFVHHVEWIFIQKRRILMKVLTENFVILFIAILIII